MMAIPCCCSRTSDVHDNESVAPRARASRCGVAWRGTPRRWACTWRRVGGDDGDGGGGLSELVGELGDIKNGELGSEQGGQEQDQLVVVCPGRGGERNGDEHREDDERGGFEVDPEDSFAGLGRSGLFVVFGLFGCFGVFAGLDGGEVPLDSRSHRKVIYHGETSVKV